MMTIEKKVGKFYYDDDGLIGPFESVQAARDDIQKSNTTASQIAILQLVEVGTVKRQWAVAESADRVLMPLGVDDVKTDESLWRISRVKFKRMCSGSATAHAALSHFYKIVTKDILQLEAAVEVNMSTAELPEIFADYYDCVDGWYLIRVGQVPPDLRDSYPRLQHKHNSIAHAELPAWQREMYYWSAEAEQFKLKLVYAAWAVED